MLSNYHNEFGGLTKECCEILNASLIDIVSLLPMSFHPTGLRYQGHIFFSLAKHLWWLLYLHNSSPQKIRRSLPGSSEPWTLFTWVVISIDVIKPSQKVCSLFQFPSSQEITLMLEFNVYSQIFFQSLFLPIYAHCYINTTATFLSGSKGHVINVCFLFVLLLISPLLSYWTGYIIFKPNKPFIFITLTIRLNGSCTVNEFWSVRRIK